MYRREEPQGILENLFFSQQRQPKLALHRNADPASLLNRRRNPYSLLTLDISDCGIILSVFLSGKNFQGSVFQI